MTNGKSLSGRKMAIYIVSFVISFSLSVELTFAEAKLFVKPEKVEASKLVAQGSKSRRAPESKIIVCSNNPERDIAALEKVAKNYLSNENYTILDARHVSIHEVKSLATLVYFGSSTDPLLSAKCFSQVAGFTEAVKFNAAIAENSRNELNERLKKQFGSKKDVVGPGYCAPSESAFLVGDGKFNWSIQLREPANANCPMSYFTVFGITELCITPACAADEQSKALETLKIFE
jgi:hypothetical protein